MELGSVLVRETMEARGLGDGGGAGGAVGGGEGGCPERGGALCTEQHHRRLEPDL